MHEFTSTELARLADYFAQELEPDDVVRVERWIEAHPERKRFVDDLRRSRFDLGANAMAEALDLQSRVETLSRSLAEIRARDESDQVRPSVSRDGYMSMPMSAPPRILARSRFTAGLFSRAAGYATGALVASVLFVMAGWYLAGQHRSSPPSVAMSTYSTGNGERATITLPDGSTILLNVASRIHVPTNYASGNRTVQLDGEALFTVAPLSGAPFTVIAGPSMTRVLGTSFVVRHYNDDTTATVAVRDGKVAVGSVVLTADQATSVSSMGTSRVVAADAEQFGFVKGELTFDFVLLPDAIPQLNRWYNAEIRLGDSSLLTKRLVGVFEAGSLTDLISILELTFNVRVVRDGRVLTLYRGS